MKLREIVRSHPLHVKCPTCGAENGKKCRSLTDPKLTFDLYHNTRKSLAMARFKNTRITR